MPINFNFKSFSDYLFPTSGKTDGTSAAQAGKSSFTSGFTSSFNAVRNSGWAKKYASFDPARLARNLSNDPRTKKAVETAKIGLMALYKQMTVFVKNFRAELHTSGLYSGGYRPTEEQRINGQWRPFLPLGAAFLPGTTIDTHSRVETVRWHKDGVQWTATYNPKTDERMSSTAWDKMDGNGWQRCQWIDHRTNTHWYASQNTAIGQHTSCTAWSMANAAGWQSCKMFDHKTNTHWSSFHHAGKDKSYSKTEWSKPGDDGVQSRKHLDQNTDTLWHETLNTKTGEHVSKTDWHPDEAGTRMQRLVKDLNTGETHIELEDPTKPSESFENDGASFDMQGRTAEEFAAASLDILGLDKNETDKATIKQQYKKQALAKHPDKVADQRDKEAVAKAKDEFAKLRNAYEFLMSDSFPVPKAEG